MNGPPPIYGRNWRETGDPSLPGLPSMPPPKRAPPAEAVAAMGPPPLPQYNMPAQQPQSNQRPTFASPPPPKQFPTFRPGLQNDYQANSEFNFYDDEKSKKTRRKKKTRVKPSNSGQNNAGAPRRDTKQQYMYNANKMGSSSQLSNMRSPGYSPAPTANGGRLGPGIFREAFAPAPSTTMFSPAPSTTMFSPAPSSYTYDSSFAAATTYQDDIDGQIVRRKKKKKRRKKKLNKFANDAGNGLGRNQRGPPPVPPSKPAFNNNNNNFLTLQPGKPQYGPSDVSFANRNNTATSATPPLPPRRKNVDRERSLRVQKKLARQFGFPNANTYPSANPPRGGPPPVPPRSRDHATKYETGTISFTGYGPSLPVPKAGTMVYMPRSQSPKRVRRGRRDVAEGTTRSRFY